MRPIERSLPLKLLQAREAVMDQFRPNLNAHGVTDQQWRVLRALAEHKRMDAGALSRLITLRMPSLSRIMNDMEARGLVVKHRSGIDRRLVDLEITPDGKALFAEMSKESERVYREMEQRIGRETYARLMDILDDLTDSLSTESRPS
ncbi:MAG: homoprotocatechuate degradation operon regulator HpaR [Pseudomonadota bacterium]